MKMDRRLTNGLAWAGALLVIGIPAADYLSGAFAGQSNPSVAVVDAAPEAVEETAAVTPAATVTPAKPIAPVPHTRPEIVTASTGTAVDSFLQSGKPLPSYITDGATPAKPAAAATPVAKPATPQQAVTQPPATQPAAPVAPVATPPATEQVAVLPARVAPTPMPLSMRPKPITVPLASSQPLIVDEAAVQAAPVVPVQNQNVVTSDDLADWESGPLSDFLARRGQQANSSVNYQVQQNRPRQPQYNNNGVWLDELQNGDRPIRRLAPSDDDVYYLPF